MASAKSVLAHYAVRKRCRMRMWRWIDIQNDIGSAEKLIGSFSMLRLTLPMSMPSERLAWLSET
jgi:hypothetical protein